MKAIVYDNSGASERLKLGEIKKPAPNDDELLIKVCAASVNPLDYHLSYHTFLRRVMAALSKGKISRPGRDVAGHVEAVGRNVTQFKPGDDVFGACNGSFAEFACAPEKALAMKPANVSFEQAAASPIAGLTALQGLRDKAHIEPGQKVLINGASGGVGTFTVQIAKAFGAKVTGVCSTKNVEMVRSIGADVCLDYTREDFTQMGQHYDFIFDLVSNHSFSEHVRALTPNGMYIGAGVLGLNGSIIKLLTTWIPELVRSPFASQKFMSFMAKLNQDDLNALGTLMAEGKVTPVIDRGYNLSEVPAAVHYLREGHARGKVIITVDQPA